MASVNRAILVGNLGTDVEIRYTQSGKAVANFSLATSETRVDAAGTKESHTTWHKITVWGKQAELCKEYLSKGRSVYVEGRIQNDSYTDKEGIKRFSTSIQSNNVVFLGSAKGNSDAVEQHDATDADVAAAA